MSKVAVWARIPVLPGKRDELVAAMQVGLETARSEAGTIYYILHTDPNNEEVVYMYELYETAEALGAHGGSDAFKALGPTLRPFTAGRPEISVITPVGGKGL